MAKDNLEIAYYSWLLSINFAQTLTCGELMVKLCFFGFFFSQLLLYVENMFYHMTQLAEDRDNCVGVSAPSVKLTILDEDSVTKQQNSLLWSNRAFTSNEIFAMYKQKLLAKAQTSKHFWSTVYTDTCISLCGKECGTCNLLFCGHLLKGGIDLILLYSIRITLFLFLALLMLYAKFLLQQMMSHLSYERDLLLRDSEVSYHCTFIIMFFHPPFLR